MSLIKTGKFEATGDDVILDLGFIPDYLKLFNADAATGEVAVIEWFNQLDAEKEFQTVIIEDDGTSGKANFVYDSSTAEVKATVEESSVQTSDPVKTLGKRGVKIDASWMEDSDVIYYLAIAADRDEDLGDSDNW
jgi:hypothetical protein